MTILGRLMKGKDLITIEVPDAGVGNSFFLTYWNKDSSLTPLCYSSFPHNQVVFDTYNSWCIRVLKSDCDEVMLKLVFEYDWAEISPEQWKKIPSPKKLEYPKKSAGHIWHMHMPAATSAEKDALLKDLFEVYVEPTIHALPPNHWGF